MEIRAIVNQARLWAAERKDQYERAKRQPWRGHQTRRIQRKTAAERIDQVKAERELTKEERDEVETIATK
jgi:hypothetical protein